MESEPVFSEALIERVAPSLDFMTKVLEALPVAVVVVENNGEIVWINREAERLFGYHRHRLCGSQLEKLVPESTRDHHPELRHSYTLNPALRPMGKGREVKALRSDGREVPVIIDLEQAITIDGIYTVAAVRRKESVEEP